MGREAEKVVYRLFLARAYLLAGKEQKGQAELESIIATHPNHVDAGKELAQIHFGKKEWKKVIDTLKEVSKLRHDYDLFRMLAESYYQSDDPKNSLKYYKEALKLNDQSPFNHYQVGNIYLGMSKYAQAANEYKRSLELGYKDSLIHYKLGTVYFNMRNYLGRIQQKRFQEANPEEIRDNLYLIEKVPGQKDLYNCSPKESAIYQVATAMEMGINIPEIRLLVANIWFHTGRFSEAVKSYKQLEGMLKKEEKALMYYYWGQACFRKREYDGYIYYLKSAIELNKEVYADALADAYYAVAKENEKLGDYSKQVEYLLLSIKETPTNPRYHYDLGNTYHRLKKYKLAIREWNITLNLQPGHPEELKLINLINTLQRGSLQGQ